MVEEEYLKDFNSVLSGWDMTNDIPEEYKAVLRELLIMQAMVKAYEDFMKSTSVKVLLQDLPLSSEQFSREISKRTIDCALELLPGFLLKHGKLDKPIDGLQHT